MSNRTKSAVLAGVLSRKAALTLLAVGGATATIMFGSWAAWTAQTTNPNTSVASGSLAMTNSKNAAAIFTASNVKPGDSGSSTVVITNSGSTAMAVALTQSGVTDSGFGGKLKMSLHDDTRDFCYYPDNAAGACSGPGAWDGSATINNLSIKNSTGGATWAAAEAHTFTVAWDFDATAGNATQSQTADFDLTWDGS